MHNLPSPHPRHVALKEEISIGKSIILGLEMDIKGLKKQIADLQSRVAYLESKKANYASYIAPLRCLPADILNIIVEFCIHGGIGLTTLMQICGVFRDVVIAMKSIWGNILLMGTGRCHNKIMDFSNSLERGIGCATAEQLALVLSRAESNPINLYIELPVMDCDPIWSTLRIHAFCSIHPI
ncbi:hypothetical protein CPB86DRAFT_57620 [Serendipita vermifera]|nr:hypothetical protein CPB86DRAFT_57620 [Serendipita vermifera]